MTYVIAAACWILTVIGIWRLPNRAAPRRGEPATVRDVVAARASSGAHS